MRRMVPAPQARVVSAEQARGVWSFADWYAACMYDPQWGYYASGRVDFGTEGDFSTYPKRLSPVFGWMLCDTIEHLLAPIPVTGDAPVTLLEFGAGDGDLAFDVLTRFDDVDPDFARRLRYRIVEPSAAMRQRQETRLERFCQAGRAEVVDGSITSYRHEGPMVGVAFANEVLDALPCEQLHITNDGIFRTHVVTKWTDGRPAFVEEWHVDIAEGWVQPDQSTGPLPPRLERHLARLAPLIDDLREVGLLPTDYYWSEAAADAIETIAELTKDNTVAGLIIDYGGTARHVLDRTLRPHLRVYSRDEQPPRRHDPYARPGAVDITWDQDFTAHAELAQAAGLNVHFGHQRVIEPRSRPLDGPFLDALAQRQADATLAAPLVRGFREARGFRSLILAGPGVSIDEQRFGASDAWQGAGLATIAPHATRADLLAACEAAGSPDLALLFGRGCDIVGTLSDLGRYSERAAVLQALRERGLLS